MGHRRIHATLATLALTLCVALVGCGGSGGTNATETDSSPASAFVGTWELASMEDTADEELETMKDMGYAMFFVLGEDGSATYEFMGYAETGTYEVTGADTATLSLDDDDDNWAPEMRIEGGNLIAESADGGACTFERVSEEEHQSYNEEHDLS